MPDVTIEQLGKWFDKKGLVNVVMRVEDIQELQPYMQSALSMIMERMNLGNLLPSGEYLILPTKMITDGRFNVAELGLLQEIVACYREIRRSKGYPMIEKPCECGGNRKCRMCEGSGMTMTLAEMSEKEANLAYERKETAQQA